MLEELDLSHNMLGDGTALMMGNILRHLPALAIINLSSCHMTQQYFFQHRMALASALQGRSSSTIFRGGHPP